MIYDFLISHVTQQQTMVYTQLCLYFDDLIILVLLFTEANETDGGGGGGATIYVPALFVSFFFTWHGQVSLARGCDRSLHGSATSGGL